MRIPVTLLTLCTLAAVATPALAEFKDIPHPFLLWTKDEAAAIKQRLDTDPVAKEQYKRMEQRDSRPVAKGSDCGNPDFLDLFKFSVLGDKAAGDRQKKELLNFIGRVPEPLTKPFQERLQKEPNWQRGMASWGDSHMRDEQTMQALRYDVLYNELTPDQRTGVEDAMKVYIKFHLDGHRPWHPDFQYSKAGWLPNMSWPRAIGTHVLAVVLKDQKSIDGMFNSLGGYKYFMDDYISDGRFYNEEFGKYYSNIFTMLLYCDGLDKLGLPQYGWGYTGKDHGFGGATMRRFLEMKYDLGYPRIDIPGGMPSYNEVQMGDSPGSTFGIEGFGSHYTIQGYLPDGKTGGDPTWGIWNMNGPLTKGLIPIWYEIGQRRYPSDHFDYFLTQMRKPGQDAYLPTLYFGLGAIEPKKTTPPSVKSFLAQERQFAMLKAEESPAYWEGPWPAVAVQFGGYYPHYAHDSFSLLGFYALNRPIYVNAWGAKEGGYVHPQIKNGPPTGYLARHPWKDTNRGHAGVTVDNLGPRPVENGEEGLKHHRMRSDFTPAVKFVAGKTESVFPNVSQERALFLTKEYLADIFWLADTHPTPQKRRYDWTVSGPGEALTDGGYKPTSELNGSMLYRPLPWQGSAEDVTDADKKEIAQPAGYENKTDSNDLTNVHKLATDSHWSATILQTCATDPAKSKLGPAYYDRKVGVRVSMLPDPATTIFTGRPPGAPAEIGGATIIVCREAPATTFVALHEPFETTAPVTTFNRIAQTDSALAAAIDGKNFSDRILLAYGPDIAKPVTLIQQGGGGGGGAGPNETFTFTSHAYLRLTKDTLTVTGNLTQLTLRVEGAPKLILNGKETPAKLANGVLTYP